MLLLLFWNYIYDKSGWLSAYSTINYLCVSLGTEKDITQNYRTRFYTLKRRQFDRQL